MSTQLLLIWAFSYLHVSDFNIATLNILHLDLSHTHFKCHFGACPKALYACMYIAIYVVYIANISIFVCNTPCTAKYAFSAPHHCMKHLSSFYFQVKKFYSQF